MRFLASLLLSPLLANAGPLADRTAWVSIPADRGVQLQVPLDLPESVTDEVIRLIGTIPERASKDAEPKSVFAVAIPNPADVESGTAVAVSDQSIPANALWPDARHRILVSQEETANPTRDGEIRNPWAVRVHADHPAEETVVECGGIIGGGESGSVAFLNGRVLTQGDSLGEFSVTRILANEVVLEGHGFPIVIPRGTRVTVTLLGH